MKMAIGVNSYYDDVNQAAATLVAKDLSKEQIKKLINSKAPHFWNFSYAGVAKVAGCSATTVRKYCDDEAIIYFLSLMAKETAHSYRSDPVHIEKNQNKTEFLEPQLNTCARNPYIYYPHNLDLAVVPDDIGGLYMLGMSSYSIETNKICFYVKIGYGTNLKKRLNVYLTTNPGATLFGCKYLTKLTSNELKQAEVEQQDKLLEHAARIDHTNDWFIVSQQVYTTLSIYGFAGLNKI